MMANEKRLIDANALLESIEGTDWYTIRVDGSATQGAASEEVAWYKATDIYAAIENAPTVDDEEVVRCKDCKYFVQGEPYDPCECMKWKVKWGAVYTTPDGYCHKGERKDNG